MKAKDMFEKLGYMQNKFGRTTEYIREDGRCIRRITFWGDRNVQMSKWHLDFEVNVAPNISTQELKAINKQVEELGWLK